MPKCPKCGKEIDYLKHWQQSSVSYEFTLDDEGYPNYDRDEIVGGEDSEWDCPECNEELFNNEEEATEFLKTK